MESGKILATLFSESNVKNGTKRLKKYSLQVERELIPAATALEFKTNSKCFLV